MTAETRTTGRWNIRDKANCPRRVAVAASLCALVAMSCGRSRTAGNPGPVASTLLALGAELGAPAAELPSTWFALEQLAAQVTDDPRAADTSMADRLRALLFDTQRFEREVTDDALRFVALPSVVAGRRGTCVGLGALYLALAERLGLEAHGVMVPGHFFVRVAENGRPPINVELLRRGEALPESWYREKYGPWSPAASAYLRPLTLAEVVAIHWFNVGNSRQKAGDLPGAEHAFARAATEFPSFAEAQASLGTARQLRGDRVGAAAAYRAAERARPDLPGLAQNWLVLRGAGDAALGLPPARDTNE